MKSKLRFIRSYFIIVSCLKYKNRSFRRESATDYIFLSTGHSGFTQKKQGLRQNSPQRTQSNTETILGC